MKSELTVTKGVDKFDLAPGDVTSERDLGRWRAFREGYHRAQRLEYVAPFPLQLDFGLNSHCNMRCLFCAQSHSPQKKELLGWDLFERAIAEAEEHGLVSVKMNHNNEPLLRSDFADHVAHAKAHGVLNVFIATNGTMLNGETARRLIDSGLSKIMVSLDATTAETYRRMRNSDRFDEIVKNILGLLEIRARMGASWPLVRVNFLRTHVNVSEADGFARFWGDKADMVGFQDQVGIPGKKNDWIKNSVDLRFSFSDFRCSFPFKHIVVAASGNLLPCCTFSGERLPLGNLREMTIKQAWESPWNVQLRSIHKSGNYRANPVCEHCVGADEQ